MKKSTNVINNVITIIVTIGLVFLVSNVANQRYGETGLKILVLLCVGAVVTGFICTLFHELGHLLVGKKNGFAFISTSVWFFKWTKVKNSIRFDFTKIGDAGGYTEMVSKSEVDIDKRFKKMTLAGNLITFILTIVGVIPLLIKDISYPVYCITVMFLPIGAYCFLGNALPMQTDGVRNDGAVLTGIRRNDDEWKVTRALLCIQSLMYQGKTPSEIDVKYYFDIPQLPEDSLNFIMMLNARYNYYLDKQDYENAQKITERLLSLCDYASKNVSGAIKTDALYNVCTFQYNEGLADDYMYELEDYLNADNNLTNVRVKLAYLLYVKKERENLETFYKKCVREANRNQIKGYVLFEKKLLDKMKKDF